MRNHNFRASIFLIITALLFCIRALPQEVEDDKKPEDVKTEEERAREKRTEDLLAGRGFLLSSDFVMRKANRRVKGLDPDFHPTTYVTFGQSKGLGRQIAFKNNYWHSFFNVSSLGQTGIQDCFTEGDLFVLYGNVSWEDEHWFKSKDYPYVIVSRSSPKKDNEYVRAAALTVQPFVPESTVLLDGLPQEVGERKGKEELRVMGLGSKIQTWQAARKNVLAAAGKIPVKRATRVEVFREFRQGNSNVLLVTAHSDSKSISLPGLAGEKISMHELEGIKRDVAPDRVIVLLACRTGAVNGETQSIAEILIKNRLASVVYASDEYVHADDLPAMLQKLQNNGTLSKAFDELHAIVQLEMPIRFRNSEE